MNEQPLMLTLLPAPTTGTASSVVCSEETGQLFMVVDTGVLVSPVAPLATTCSNNKQQPFIPVVSCVQSSKPQTTLASRYLLSASPKRFRSVSASPISNLACVCGGRQGRTVIYGRPRDTGASSTWKALADVTEFAFSQHWAPTWKLPDAVVRPVDESLEDVQGVVYDADDALVVALAQGTECLMKRGAILAKPPPVSALRGDLHGSVLAQRVACAVPHCSAWSPVIAKTTLLLAAAAPSAVVVMRLPQHSGTRVDLAVADVLMQPTELGPVSVVSFSQRTTVMVETGCEWCMLAVASVEGSVVIYRFGVTKDGIVRRERFAEVAKPCNRHVSAMLWVCEKDDSKLAFAHGGKLCVSSQTGGVVAAIDAHLGAITSVAYSRIMRMFFTGSTDGTIRSWKLEGASLLACDTIPIPGGAIPTGVSCSPSGAFLWFSMCAFTFFLFLESSFTFAFSSRIGEGATSKSRSLLYSMLLIPRDASSKAICDAICEPVLSKRQTTKHWLSCAIDLAKLLVTKQDAIDAVMEITSELLRQCHPGESSQDITDSDRDLLHLVYFLCSPFAVRAHLVSFTK